MKTNHQWTPIDTNRPEDRWTCFNDKGRQNASSRVPLRVHQGDVVELLERVPNSLPGSAGVPPAPSLAQPRPSPPLGSTGNGAMALLRPPGQGGSRRQGGCLQHCTEAQRQPKGQHAGGTPALPGKAGPADRVAACGIALKLSGSQRDSMRAGRPRSRARQKPGTWFTPFINALFIPFVVLRG